MMDNNLQQSLRELRSHRKLPEREGEYWSDEEREKLSQKFNEGAGISEIAVLLNRSEPAIMQQIEKLDLFDRKENPRRQRVTRQLNCLCGRCGNDPALCPLRTQCGVVKER